MRELGAAYGHHSTTPQIHEGPGSQLQIFFPSARDLLVPRAQVQVQNGAGLEWHKAHITDKSLRAQHLAEPSCTFISLFLQFCIRPYKA